MEVKYKLIVPMLNASKKYENSVPIEFQYDNKSGKMNCMKSIEGINLSSVYKIYFIIFEKHEILYNISNKIMLHKSNNEVFKNIEFIFNFVKSPTSSQAETVYNAILINKIEGPIFIKDADNMAIVNKEIKGNSVLVYPLENTPIVDPQHKSYISVDDQNFVTNIIEKRVVSNLFNCGGYCFKDSNDFKEAYEHILEFEDIVSHMYISHIIYWLILHKKLKFRPIEADDYEDFEIKNIN